MTRAHALPTVDRWRRPDGTGGGASVKGCDGWGDSGDSEGGTRVANGTFPNPARPPRRSLDNREGVAHTAATMTAAEAGTRTSGARRSHYTWILVGMVPFLLGAPVLRNVRSESGIALDP